MKLLFVADTVYTRHRDDVYGLRVYGREYFADYLEAFSEVAICARVKTADAPPADMPQTNSDRIRFFDIPDVHGWRWVLGWDGRIKAILNRAVEQCDAVVTRMPGFLGSLALPLAKKHGKPVMAEVVGDSQEAIRNYGTAWPYQWLAWRKLRDFQRFMKKTDVAAYVNHSVLPKKYPVAPGVPYDVYVDIQLQEREIASPRTYTSPPETFQMIGLMNFIPYKRHQDLIRACAVLKENRRKFQLHLIGDGGTLPAVQSLVQRLDLSDDVVFHGYVADPERMRQEMAHAHVTILPSATEGLPRSLIEGMALGLGAVGSDAGGIPDLVRPSEVFRVGDVKTLAKMLLEIADSPERLTEMSRHAVETAKQYAASVISPQRIRLYRILAERARR